MDPITAVAFSKIARIDPPRIDPRTGLEEAKVRALVKCIPLLQVLPGGHLVKKGENYIEAYVSDLRKIEALVETATETELGDVQREYERQMKKWRKENRNVPERACPINPEAAFHHVMGRDRLPLESVEVLKDDAKKGATKAA
jgi:hypothetical protein